MAKDSPKTASRATTNLSVSIWAALCGKCFKWRTLSTQQQFEEIRSRFVEQPFNCDNKTKGSCDDPPDIEYDSSRTWSRRDYSKMDAYYITPSWKKLRSMSEVGNFLQQNPEYSDISVSDFSFTSPKVKDDTIPSSVVLANSNNKATASCTK
ncbi:unnamed protein product [Withania somnifera]